MRLQHPTEPKGRPSRRTATLGVIALLASLVAACSSGPKGIVVNLYGGASGTGFDKIIANCNQAAGGRYTIVGNLLPVTPTASATSSCAGSPPTTTAWTCSAWT